MQSLYLRGDVYQLPFGDVIRGRPRIVDGYFMDLIADYDLTALNTLGLKSVARYGVVIE